MDKEYIYEGDYKVLICEKIFLIQSRKTNKIVLIERNPFRISFTTPDFLRNVMVLDSFRPHAILGIITLNDFDYLLYVKKALKVTTFNDNNIFKIEDVDILPITEDSVPDSDSLRLLNSVKTLLKKGFYYSFDMDLTNSFQKQSKYKSINVIETVEKNYFWNFNLCKEFLSTGVESCFITILIYGYVECINYLLTSQQKLSILLISRRSWSNPNQIDFSTGINEDGNVYNHVESETVLLFDNYLCSFTSLRGTPPIPFDNNSSNKTFTIKINKTPELIKPIFLKHIQCIQKDYHFIYFINLLSNQVPGEQSITKNLEYQFQINDFNFCKYQYFSLDDLSNRNEVEEKIEKFLNSLDKIIEMFKVFCQNSIYGDIISEQRGTFRLICFDSLGKSNLIQSKIVFKMIEKFLKTISMKVNTVSLYNEGIVNKDFKLQEHEVFKALKKMHFQNGKEIENQIKGENYLKEESFLTETEESNKEVIEILLQKNKNISEKKMRIDELLIHIGTWNMAGLEIGKKDEIIDWLKSSKAETTPDLYIIGFQEIVDLNPSNIVFTSNQPRVDFWKNTCYSTLSQLDNYVLLKSLDLVGILLLIFCKESIRNNIKNANSVIMKTGFMGTLGNKGNVIFRFDFNNVNFAISCCHLTSDLEKNASRVKEVTDILVKNVYPNPSKELKFKDHQMQFVFGDLNFRIELENNLCRQLIKENKLNDILVFDQFNKAKANNPLFYELDEGEIDFPPTYKYDFNSNEYDTSKKKRIPSYTDRILYKKNKSILLLDYGTCGYTYSDHRPVYGLFKVSTLGNDVTNKTDFPKISTSPKKFIDEERNKIPKKSNEGNGNVSKITEIELVKDNNVGNNVIQSSSNVNLIDFDEKIKISNNLMLKSPKKQNFVEINDKISNEAKTTPIENTFDFDFIVNSSSQINNRKNSGTNQIEPDVFSYFK